MGVKDLCNENYKTLMKEVKEDRRRWKDLLYSWMGRSDAQIRCNPHQNNNNIIHRTRKENPTFHMEAQKTLNSQSNVKQKERCWRHHNT
jgi:hypothetical protein